MKKLNLFILSVLVTAIAFAQAPQKMSYQAVIRDASQALVINQSVGMQISILQGSASGTVIYVETQQPTSNMNGLVTIEIGNGNVILGNFSTIDWANGPYFIKTETDPTGGISYTISGTSQLLSVPYALYAENSGSSIPGPQGPAGSNGMDGIDGVDGIDGISITWLGSFTSAPGSPNLNEAYYNTTSLQSFVWNGTAWNVIAKDGINGVDGADGSLNAWSLTGNAGTNPSTNFIGTTDNVSFNFKVNNQKAGRIDPLGPVFYGYQSGNANTNSGATVYNTAVGHQALFTNISGSFNTALGFNALYNNTNWSNTAIGAHALFDNTSGNDNTGVGRNALSTNISGVFNTALGSNSLRLNTTGTHNTALGSNAMFSNTIGIHNTASGFYAMSGNTTGNYNTSQGYHSLFGNNTGSLNTALGYRAFFSGTYSNSTALGSNSIITASNQVRLGDISITSIGGQVGWTTLSDARLKKDVKENVAGLDFILKLNPVTYSHDINAYYELLNLPDSLRNKNYEKNASELIHTGFLAQDVEKAAKEVGFDFSGVDKPKNSTDYYGLRYSEFVVPLVKAIQEQQKMIEQQQLLIEDMQKEIDLLKK